VPHGEAHLDGVLEHDVDVEQLAHPRATGGTNQGGGVRWSAATGRRAPMGRGMYASDQAGPCMGWVTSPTWRAGMESYRG
jgi:hypothetical protein